MGPRTGTRPSHGEDFLARNLDDLRKIVLGLTQRGVMVEFVEEHLTFTGDDSAMSKLLLSVMGAFAEFERLLLKERQTPDCVTELRSRAVAGEKKAVLAREFKISRETLYPVHSR